MLFEGRLGKPGALHDDANKPWTRHRPPEEGQEPKGFGASPSPSCRPQASGAPSPLKSCSYNLCSQSSFLFLSDLCVRTMQHQNAVAEEPAPQQEFHSAQFLRSTTPETSPKNPAGSIVLALLLPSHLCVPFSSCQISWRQLRKWGGVRTACTAVEVVSAASRQLQVLPMLPVPPRSRAAAGKRPASTTR